MFFVDRNNHDSNPQLLKKAIWLLAVLLFPAIIVSGSLKDFQMQLSELDQREQQNEATIAISRLNREMHLKSVVDEAIRNFAAQVEVSLTSDIKSPALIRKFDQIFFHRFPDSVRLLWFNKTHRLVPSVSAKKLLNRTVWEKFILRVSNPDQAKISDKKIAAGFIKSEMSDFLTPDFFSNINAAPIEVLLENERVFLRLVKLASPENSSLPAGFLVILPIERARKDWLETRALRKISNQSLLAGAFRFSDQSAIYGSMISENLLHGFSEKFKRGILTSDHEDFRYYFSYHFENPDIFLCIAMPSSKNELFKNLFTILRILAFFPFLAALYHSFGNKNRSAFSRLSLKTRFRLATVGLTVAPILLMTFAGLLYLVRLNTELEQSRLNQLDNAIDNYSDSITRQTSQLENFLRNNLSQKLQQCEDFAQMSEKAFTLLKDSGCHLAMILSKEGEIYHTTSLEDSLARNRMSFFIGMIKLPLINEGFAVAELERKTKSALGDRFSQYREKKFRYDFYNRLNAIEMGPTVANLFTTFIYNDAGKIVACVGVGFEAETMRQFFLKKALRQRRQTDTSVFLRPLTSSGAFYHPHSTAVDELLKLSALTGKPFERNLSLNGRNYLIRSRLLRNSQTAAAAVMRIDKSQNDSRMIFLAIFSLILALAVLNSHLIIKVFDRLFLQPIFALTSSVKSIRDGDYQIAFTSHSQDEIGTLQESFSKMADGLREKAEMKKYLNQDLYSEAESQQQTEFVKTTGTVMFCGIRDFSRFEKEMPAEEAFSMMNRFLSVCDRAVSSNSGKIDKFIGETAMAFFKDEQGLNNAVAAALQIQHRLAAEAKDLPDSFCYGIGIAGGELIAGQIGSRRKRLDYTVIGDPVNLAARLEKLAGRKGTPEILTSANSSLEDSFATEKFATIKVKGKAQPVAIVKVSGPVS